MKRLEKLLAEFCPDGVEYIPLGEVCRRRNGTSITAGQMRQLAVENGDVRVFAAGETVVDVAATVIPEKDIIREPGIVVKARGYIGFEYCVKPFTHKNELWSYTALKDGIDLKYVFFYLMTQADRLQYVARSKSVKLPQLSISDTDVLPIPLPPLAIQKEIVRILDGFTGLIDELEEELAARQKQYEQYREKLLAFDDGVEWKKLGDVCVILDSERKPVSQKNRVNGQYPYYGANGIQDYVDGFIFDGIYLLVGEDGSVITANGNPILTWAEGRIWVNNHAHVLKEIRGTKLRYLYHYLHTADISKFVRGMPPKLNQENLVKIDVLVPPIAEQQRIIEILDKFDALCNDETVGLAAEIAARKKQYEHYREKLLTFKKKAS